MIVKYERQLTGGNRPEMECQRLPNGKKKTPLIFQFQGAISIEANTTLFFLD